MYFPWRSQNRDFWDAFPQVRGGCPHQAGESTSRGGHPPPPPSPGHLIVSNSKPLTWSLSGLRGRCASGGTAACCSAAPGGGAGTSLEAWWAACGRVRMTRKQPRCPSADEWIRKLWYIYMMDYYSAIKKNAFESVLMRWMKLEPIIQSDVSQKEKTPIHYSNTYIWNSERWQRWPYTQDTKRDTDVKNRLLDSGRRWEWDD